MPTTTDMMVMPAIAPPLSLFTLLLLLGEGGSDGAAVGATVMMMTPVEVAFTKPAAPNFSAFAVSCVLKKPLDLTELKRSLAKFSLGNPLSGRLSTNGDYSRFIVDGVRDYHADLFESLDSCV